jgi:hypothetical protein
MDRFRLRAAIFSEQPSLNYQRGETPGRAALRREMRTAAMQPSGLAGGLSHLPRGNFTKSDNDLPIVRLDERLGPFE